MRKLKDSGIEWIGKIPENWKVQRAKTLFSQRLTKGNQDITLLAATQKYGMLPQSEVEGVVQVKENADLEQFCPRYFLQIDRQNRRCRTADEN